MTAMARVSARAALALPLVWAASGCGPAENTYVEPPPPTVTVAHPLRQTVTTYLEETGETESVERAEVRARVRGFIESIEFEPGQAVEKGAVLYRIQPDEYQAAVESAEAEVAAAKAAISVATAEKATAEAEVNRAERELERQQSLKAQDATSQTELDQAIAADESAKAKLESATSRIEAARAQLQQSEARLSRAKLDLGYTEVRAPIAGEVTKAEVKLGNLVDNGTELTTVVDDSRIFANFNVSDRQLLRFLERQTESPQSPRPDRDRWRQTPVFLSRDIDQGYPFQGRLDYVDREGIDAGTGTLSLRAAFDNAGAQLVPGLFVSVQIPLEETPDALIVPELAVQRDRVGDYVLGVTEQGKVERRGVGVGARRGGWAVIESGLSEGDRIVVEGLQRARPGAAVAPEPTELNVDNDEPFSRQRPGENKSGESEASSPNTPPASDG